MTPDNETIQVSQGYVLLTPQSGEAYMIPCDEWLFLKERLNRVSKAPWFFHTAGSILVGAALTTVGAILTGTVPDPMTVSAGVIAAAVGTCGALCWFFAWKERKLEGTEVKDVVHQMDIIERRFGSSKGTD